MTPKEASTLGAVILATVAVIALVDEKEIKTEKVAGLTKLAVLPDGGKAYVVTIELDAGAGKVVEELRIAKTPGCVRRVSKTPTDCMRRVGGKDVDPGDLNRFHESEASGPSCQPVACSVRYNEDADEDEDTRVTKSKEAK